MTSLLDNVVRRGDLQWLDPAEFIDHALTEKEITKILKLSGALWIHSGKPKDPHAELTSGRHSDGFVNVLKALVYSNLRRIFAHQLAKLLHNRYLIDFKGTPPNGFFDWVVGSDHAGAALALAVGEELGSMSTFTEKDQTPGSKRQIWNRHDIEPEQIVLQVEELVTTSLTLSAVRTGICEGTPHKDFSFGPYALTLVDRSDPEKPVTDIDGTPVLHLVRYDIRTWKPGECPLCKGGSEALKPKANWKQLTGKS